MKGTLSVGKKEQVLYDNQIRFWKQSVMDALQDDPNSLLRMEVMEMLLSIETPARVLGLTKSMITTRINLKKEGEPLGLDEATAATLQPDTPPQETREQVLDRAQTLMFNAFDEAFTKPLTMNLNEPPGPGR